MYLAEIPVHVYLAEILVFFKNTPLNFLTPKNLPILFFGTNLYRVCEGYEQEAGNTRAIRLLAYNVAASV